MCVRRAVAVSSSICGHTLLEYHSAKCTLTVLGIRRNETHTYVWMDIYTLRRWLKLALAVQRWKPLNTAMVFASTVFTDLALSRSGRPRFSSGMAVSFVPYALIVLEVHCGGGP